MKKVFGFLVLLLAINFGIVAQNNPVKWTTKAEKISDTEYQLVIDANLESGWNIYSQYLPSDDGPVRTTIQFNGDGLQLIGKVEENGNKKEGFDEMFGMNVIKFSKHVTFTQKVKVAKGTKNVLALINFMTCDDSVCLPPRDTELEFSL